MSTTFLEVHTTYGVVGYFSSVEKKAEIFDKHYFTVPHVTRQYPYDAEIGGNKIYTIYYKDAPDCPAFASNNKERALMVQKKYNEMMLSDEEIICSSVLDEMNVTMADIMDRVVDVQHGLSQTAEPSLLDTINAADII